MDYNPVAVLILKVLLEYIPKYGHRLAEEVKKWGEWIKKEAEKELSEFYPKDPDGSTPIAYIWARTIRCEGPGCGVEVPLMRSLWLAKKGRNSVALKMIPNKKDKRVDFEIIKGDLKEKDVQPGTVKRGSATCPVCGYTTPVGRVKEQAKEKGLPVRMVVIVSAKRGQSGKNYRLPTAEDLKAVELAKRELEKRKREHKGNLSLVPDEPMDQKNMNLVSGRGYGFKKWSDLFTPRQALALSTFVKILNKNKKEILSNNKDSHFAKAIITSLSFAISRCADYWSSLCVLSGDFVGHTFGRQAIAMVWDFAEVNPFSGFTGDWSGAVEWIKKVIQKEENGIDMSVMCSLLPLLINHYPIKLLIVWLLTHLITMLSVMPTFLIFSMFG
jgi:adenine-specific DNA methylase